jgi:hypothetical protein
MSSTVILVSIILVSSCGYYPYHNQSLLFDPIGVDVELRRRVALMTSADDRRTMEFGVSNERHVDDATLVTCWSQYIYAGDSRTVTGRGAMSAPS